eukprot:3128532-Pyramimonas_sp.AAC.1
MQRSGSTTYLEEPTGGSAATLDRAARPEVVDSSTPWNNSWPTPGKPECISHIASDARVLRRIPPGGARAWDVVEAVKGAPTRRPLGHRSRKRHRSRQRPAAAISAPWPRASTTPMPVVEASAATTTSDRGRAARRPQTAWPVVPALDEVIDGSQDGESGAARHARRRDVTRDDLNLALAHHRALGQPNQRSARRGELGPSALSHGWAAAHVGAAQRRRGRGDVGDLVDLETFRLELAEDSARHPADLDAVES